MSKGISHYTCKCGVRVHVLSETDKPRIDEVVLLEVVCPNCAEKASVHGHRILKEIFVDESEIP